jgi:MFS family permease
MLDRYSVALPSLLFIGGQAVGCVLIAAHASNPMTIFGAMLVGAGLGAESDLMPFILRRTYGMRAFGGIFGLSFTMLSLGTVVGPGATGLIFDWTGSYTPMLAVFAVAGVAAAILIGSHRLHEGDIEPLTESAV